MKPKFIIFLIVIALMLSGCLSNKSNQTEQKKDDNTKKDNTIEVTKKYYDESRLTEKVKSYHELFENFSFIVDHPLDPNNEFGEKISRIYSFKSTDRLKANQIYLKTTNMNTLTLLYSLNSDNIVNISVNPSTYTKSNYKEQLSKGSKIIKETDEYFEFSIDGESNTSFHSLVKWYDNYAISFSTNNIPSDVAITILEEAASTVTKDNNDALLVDKAVQSMVNYEGKQLKSYSLIYSINNETGIYAIYEDLHMNFSYKRWISLSCSEYTSEKINENPEIYKCADNDYRVQSTNHSIETYYYFEKKDIKDDKLLQTTSVQNLKQLLNIFFEN